MQHFTIADADAQDFIKKAQKISYLRGIKASTKTIDIVKKHLKAAVAFRLFGEVGKSLIINQEEGVFSKSLEVLKNYDRILHTQSNHTKTIDY